MTGARALALEYLKPLLHEANRVLDVCAGDQWLKWHVQACDAFYIGVDIKSGYDLTKENLEEFREPDLIVSCYGLQHLLSEEARVWTMLRRIAKPTTKFAYIGRWYETCCLEMNRQDPLNGHNEDGLRGLALASGWQVVEFGTALYSNDEWRRVSPSKFPNAFTAIMEPLP